MSGSGLAAAVLVLASTSAAGASTTAAATHDSVRWQGRTLRNTNGTVGYSYAGVSFHFTVQGWPRTHATRPARPAQAALSFLGKGSLPARLPQARPTSHH